MRSEAPLPSTRAAMSLRCRPTLKSWTSPPVSRALPVTFGAARVPLTDVSSDDLATDAAPRRQDRVEQGEIERSVGAQVHGSAAFSGARPVMAIRDVPPAIRPSIRASVPARSASAVTEAGGIALPGRCAA